MRLEKILEIVEKETNFDLNVKKRKRELVYSRAVYFKLAREHTKESLHRIGRLVNKDHATALHGIKVFEEQILEYSDAEPYYEIYKKLSRYIKRANGTRLRDKDPATYYRDKYSKALLELRKERADKRLLKEQLGIKLHR